ncbi:hypothetical protein [Desulfogranum marinum]|uniref:hypothetical protein n=1 Tax=Desulfogranum marinum TaxID=453220 RepID=UPI001965DE9F|nr:hypothetical protein [Desulfogranum marinum]MBM9512883.1 hypothetical protein [Desulfogranum marinum]
MLDSGNLLFKPRRSGQTVSSTDQAKATIIAQTFIAGQNVVAAVGSNDLVAGSSFLKKLEEKYSFHFLSANLAAAGADKPIFQPFTFKMIDHDFHVAIIGLTGRPLSHLPSEQFSLLSWETILPKLITQLSSHADMILLLSNLPSQENEKIAKKFDAINIIFQSGNVSRGNSPPYLVNNALICQTTTRGKYQGTLEIKWNESRKWQKHAKIRIELKQIKRQLQLVTQKIEQSKQVDSGTKRHENRLLGLQRLKQKLEGQQKQLQQQLNHNKSYQGATYNNRFIALSSKVEDDPQTVQRIRAAGIR